jgi:hypothetical protein
MRAIWGKMHRASTDSRWIAASEGFDPSAELAIRALTVSTEDEPRTSRAWKQQGSGWMAIHAYPSRARDAAGRSGGLEKQLLFARADSAMPPTVAAFILLEAASRLDDSVWWDTWNDPNWEDYRYHLVLPPEPDIAWSTASLAQRIERGIEELRTKFSHSALAAFYQDILNSRLPAFLCAEPDLISPEALASLLLPLPPATAAKTSLLSGLPDSRLAADRLQAWTGVVSRLNTAVPPVAAGPNAQRMAESLISANPGLLASDATTESVAVPAGPKVRERTAQRLIDFLESAEFRALCGPELAVADWRAIRSEAEIQALVERIRLLESDLEQDRSFPDDPERYRARIDQLRVKYDQARSWLYAFAPGPRILEQAPPRPGTPVAALRFVHLLAPEDWVLLNRYTEENWARLIAHSLKQAGQFEKRTREWLQQFAPGAPASIRQLLERYARG